MMDLLKQLCGIDGVSGCEDQVRDFLKQACEARGGVTTIDPMGNLLVFKQGRTRPKNKVVLAAHMDEVGLIAQHITEDGFISVFCVGGILSSVVIGRQFRFANGTIGVVGYKPIHMCRGNDEYDNQPKVSDLYLDIGCDSREEAEKYVQPGDCCTFVSEFFEFGEGYLKGKAIDDRFGCAVMLDMMNQTPECDLHFAFTVQEEIGTRGARAAAFNLNPDIAIVIESTTACDIPGSTGANQVCKLGGGVVISHTDRSTSYDRELYRLAFEVAKEHAIPAQTKTKIAGGNDAGAFQRTASGSRVIALSIPCRYLHSPACVVKRMDCLELRILAEKLAERAANL
jgi:endoglucanase